MRNNEKASLQILKITLVALILIFSLGIVAKAFNSEINTVKIKLSNNYELNVVTTKTKISEILADNHIIVLPDETVFPDIESQIGENRTITIAKTNSEELKNKTIF